MNRRTWAGVMVVLLLLVAAGGVSPALEWLRGLGAALPRPTTGLVPGSLPAAAAILLGLVPLLLVGRRALARLGARGPRGVLVRARRGRPLHDIARDLRLSQDAVRLVLRTDGRGARSRS